MEAHIAADRVISEGPNKNCHLFGELTTSSGSYGRRHEFRDKQVEGALFNVGIETWTTRLVQSRELTQPSDSMLF